MLYEEDEAPSRSIGPKIAGNIIYQQFSGIGHLVLVLVNAESQNIARLPSRPFDEYTFRYNITITIQIIARLPSHPFE